MGMTHIRTLTGLDDARACVLSGDYLYVADNDVGILRLNQFDADDVKTLALPGIYGIEAWYDSILCISGSALRFYTRDLVFQGEMALPGYTYRGIQRMGNILYVALYTTGQGVLKIDLLTRTYSLATLSNTLEDVSVSPSGELIATAAYGANIVIYDASFNVVNTIELVDHITHSVRFIGNDVLYAGIFDVSNVVDTLAVYSPITGTLLDSITEIDGDAIETVYGITHDTGALFICAGSVIYILDAYKPDALTEVSTQIGVIDGGISVNVDADDVTIDATDEYKRVVPIRTAANKYRVRRVS